jgi:integrase/recombinase XerD
MSTSPEETFDRNYARHLQHLTLKGLQPKSIEAYSRAIRRIGERFDHQIDALSEQQLLDYFTELVASHSWSSVKLDLYGLKFYYEHVLRRPWAMPGLIKPPKSAFAGHRHGRRGQADCRLHTGAQLPSVLLHAL